MVNPIFQQDEELLLNPLGSKYLTSGTYTDVNSSEFVVQEDTIISVLMGGDASIAENNIDYKVSMNLRNVTLKKGALIVAPVGEAFKSITIDSGAIMAYNSVFQGEKPSGSVPLLLDSYSDASAAYSLRKLRTEYTGDAIQVRRSVGTPANQNIGFDSNGELDTASLLSFVGSGDGFVVTWYDQSGNGHNAVNVSASTQPRIVSSGVVDLLNDKPSLYANGDSLLGISSFKFDDSNGQVSCFGAVNASSSGLVLNGDTSPRVYRPIQVFGSTSEIGALSFNNPFAVVQDRTPYTLGNDCLFSTIRKVGSLEVWNNGVSDGSTTTSGIFAQSPTSLTMFRRTSTDAVTAYVPEIILYPSDQTENRVGIETNINDYYTIYE